MAGLALPVASSAQVICAANVSAPPELPVYEQPPVPAPGYMWTPGYWSSGPEGYFWVPGTWVLPPRAGLLWTPGYWAWHDGIYVWNAGYWGPHIGFYGGVNYGFGYVGEGFEGGRWENGVFAYNRAANNLGGISITSVYEKTIVVDPNVTRVSFNGGSGGMTARPTPEQEAAAHEEHVSAIPAQLQHERMAGSNTALLASQNHGRPAIAATAKPGDFAGKGVVAAREEPKVMPPATKPPGATTGPTATAPKIPEKDEHAGQMPGQAEPKQLNTEAKPLNTEAKPPNTEVKPPNTEAKLPNAEAKPPNTGAKLPNAGAKPPNTEARLPNAGTKLPNTEARTPATQAKPLAAVPPKAPTPPAPHVAAAPKPHPPAAPPPKPAPKDKHPPG